MAQAIEYCDTEHDDGQTEVHDCQELTFVDAMYFVCITMTTVGYEHYTARILNSLVPICKRPADVIVIRLSLVACSFGDVAPRTYMGKLFDMALIMFAGVLIPIQISGYSTILSREVRDTCRVNATQSLANR